MWRGGISTHSKWGDPHKAAQRANTAARHSNDAFRMASPVENDGRNQPSPWGWHGSEWQGRNSPEERAKIAARFDQFLPGLSSAGQPGAAGDFFNGLLPQGASLAPGAGGGYRDALRQSANRGKADRRTAAGGLPLGGSLGGSMGGGNGVFTSASRPYQPEFESPDRQNYPVHRNLANVYWRLFYKLDALIGNAVDMYSELPWGNFELTGDGVDGEVKDAFERMCEVCHLRTNLPYFIREYLVIGEACPHLFYDDNEGIWTYIGMHNPDQLEVVHTPFIKMEPIVRFKPDNRLQQVLMSDHEMIQAIRDSMPPELMSALLSGQPIDLSPVNFTFLARKMHPYDVRGTSIISRMWRALMYEDSIFNASIATARRHAGPIKVAKLGDPQTGWIPGPEHERKLIELLAQAETDPHAWLVYHYGINFDLVGTTERVMTIDKHWDLIERIKLIALGISKAFLHGEVSYASAASGLTIFLQRLKAMRQYIESAWIYPKFFRPIAEMNAWVKPTPAELSHGVRTRRSRQELLADDRYIVPKIEWDRRLDPSIEQAQLTAIQALSGLGVTFSKQYMASLVGRDWEEELQQRGREATIEKKMIEDNPDLAAVLQPAPEEAMGGMGGGMGGPMPGPIPGIPDDLGLAGGPPNMEGEPGPMGVGEGMSPPPEAGKGQPFGEGGEYAADGDAGRGGPSGRHTRLKSKLWEDGKYGPWTEDEVMDLIEVFEGYPPDDALWSRMADELGEAGLHEISGGMDEGFGSVEAWLLDAGYPPREISQLEAILHDEISGPTSSTKQGRKPDIAPSESISTGLLVGAP